MKHLRYWFLAGALIALTAGFVWAGGGNSPSAHVNVSQKMHINCSYSAGMCTDIADSARVFGWYVGQDEPGMLFYSNHPGSGNHARFNLTLPKDPSPRHPTAPGKSYAFELYATTWIGMVLCDTQADPEQVKTCPPDTDRNILDPAVSPKHVGEAYLELQFYPPGWVQWPAWAKADGTSSCDPTRWCAAMNIDSLQYNPVTNQTNNPTCLSKVGELAVNFAFITKSGVPQASPNPLASTLSTFTPSAKDLFMNSGDNLNVSLKDSKKGLNVMINDLTSGQNGSMTASSANGFAQLKWDPRAKSCTSIPYDFHPMYSTSSPQTRDTWAIGSYNVAMVSEVGHFQTCQGPERIQTTEFGIDSEGNPVTCPSGDTVETARGPVPGESDDLYCFPSNRASTYKVPGCSNQNSAFDGASYQNLWPDGNTRDRPTPFQFSSPTTGRNYSQQYQKVAFEADLPQEETGCNMSTGAGCTRIPQTSEGYPAAFYPFYSMTRSKNGCVWQLGGDTPGEITNFGRDAEYGPLTKVATTTTGGGAQYLYQYFRNEISNPCPDYCG
jgi:hypothetical protein